MDILKQNECSYCDVFLKFEPMVLHVFCANLNSAKVLVSLPTDTLESSLCEVKFCILLQLQCAILVSVISCIFLFVTVHLCFGGRTKKLWSNDREM